MKKITDNKELKVTTKRKFNAYMKDAANETFPDKDYAVYKQEIKAKANDIIEEMRKENLNEPTRQEARYLITMYYQMQKNRIAFGNQSLKLVDPKIHPNFKIENILKEHPDFTPEQAQYYALPHNTSRFMMENLLILEEIIKGKLSDYANSRPEGRWLNSIVGIGPVLSAGLLAYCAMEYRVYDKPAGAKNRQVIGTERVKYPGQLQKFAGLDPTQKWESGKLRPWNATLKTLCWKCGQSFIKVKNHKNDFYGHWYEKAKIEYTRKNNAGEYAERAAEILNSKKFKETMQTDEGYKTSYAYYKEGMLPPAHISAMASRWVEKLLLSHIHTVFYQHQFREKVAAPYAFAVLNHDWGNYIAPPNYDEEHCKEFGLYYINPIS